MQERRVQPLGWEGALEKEMATHSSILAWRIPWTEEPGEPQSMGAGFRGGAPDSSRVAPLKILPRGFAP